VSEQVRDAESEEQVLMMRRLGVGLNLIVEGWLKALGMSMNGVIYWSILSMKTGLSKPEGNALPPDLHAGLWARRELDF